MPMSNCLLFENEQVLSFDTGLPKAVEGVQELIRHLRVSNW
jgi:hypothetical protein